MKTDKLVIVIPSIWQQPNKRGEEHKEAYTSEGKSYPGGWTDEQVTNNPLTENLTTLHLCKTQTGEIPCFG